VACRSLPRDALQYPWIFILPPDFSAAQPASLATPFPNGWSCGTAVDTRSVRPWNSAPAPVQNSAAEAQVASAASHEAFT
jgi:hypothetical protein